MTSHIDRYKSLLHLPILGRVSLILGQPDSGKSFLIYDFISKAQTLPGGPMFAKILILSPTAKDQEYWKGIPPGDVHTEPEAYGSIMNQVLEYQRSLEKSMQLPILIMVDDCIGQLDGQAGKDFKKNLKKLATSGRHNKISVIVISQSYKDGFLSNPQVRQNCSCIVSAIINGEHRTALEKDIGPDSKSAKIMTNEAWSEPYQFICYDQTTGCSGPRYSYCKVDPKSVIKGFSIKYRR